jgi:hypothetical protein
MCNEISTAGRPSPADLTPYDTQLLRVVQDTFHAAISRAGDQPQLFQTDPGGVDVLWDLFISRLPAELRQTYNCSACRHFMRRSGGLAVLDDDGALAPAMWPEEPIEGPFAPAVHALWRTVRQSKITGPFLTSDSVLGTPITGQWSHFAVHVSADMLFRHPLKTARQAMAEKREDFKLLKTALAEFSIDTVRSAVHLLSNGDALYRSEKVLGVAQWLLDLIDDLRGQRHYENLIWRAVAAAPPGFCHIRSTMIGTLLADIQSGLDIDDIRRSFAAKMSPLQYQRPTAAPSSGQIAQAEKAVETLAAAGAFKRRFAKLEDIEAIWKPAPKRDQPAGEGLFASVKPASKKGTKRVGNSLPAPTSRITWEKFRRKVLPDAKKIEYYTGHGTPLPFINLTTAVDPGAPPILQWDSDERRNPVGWFVYSGGMRPGKFNLSTGSWVNVSAICLLPPMWHDEEHFAHQGKGAILLLDGARDLHYTKGAIFFPEQLRSEYHQYRKTLEAYSLANALEGADEATAAGIDLRAGNAWSETVRVTTDLGMATYILERWD